MMRELIVARCREFVREQSEGEWDDKTINADAEKMADMVQSMLRPVEPLSVTRAQFESECE